MREQSEAFNRLIFGGKVELDEVLASEQTFDFILKNINQYCHRSAEIWREATQRQVDIFSLKEKMNEKQERLKIKVSEKNSILDEIAELDATITNLDENIRVIEGEISVLNDNIEKNKQEIRRLEQRIEENEKLFAERVNVMFKSPKGSYMQVLLR